MEHLDTMMKGTDMAEPIDNSIQDIDAHTTCYRVFTYTQYLVSNQDDKYRIKESNVTPQKQNSPSPTPM